MLDFNLVKKKKFYGKQDENDQKAAIGVKCVLRFVGPPPTFLATPATLNLFDKGPVADCIVGSLPSHFQSLLTSCL